MEKKVLFSILILFLIFIIPLTFAAQEDVDDAYSCLEGKINDKTCKNLALSEKIFVVLATGECKNELRADAKNEECWPKENCDIKTTSQALLALGGPDVRDWLLDQNGTPSEITWYLQVESSLESACVISYDGDDYSIEIGEDKKIDSNAGSCLSVSSSGYWLEIDSDCYEEKFEISCDKYFITNLLFKSDTSSTIHVSGETSSSLGDGTTTEEVNSFCFIDGGTCDYEGSLWATLALDSMGRDIFPYVPYLITMADENREFFPEVFLYALTGYEDFRYEIISRQASNGYWSISGNKYYDTALALYPFGYDEFSEKDDAKEWLINQQENDGCWNSGNILDTAFILYSIWPEVVPIAEGSCLDREFYCMLPVDCGDAGGIELNYSCSGSYVCCDTPKVEESCEDAGGKICTGGKECTEDTLEYSDTYYCCFAECGEPEPEPEEGCVFEGGVCEPYECGEGYVQNDDYECNYYGDFCCMPEDRPEINSLLWILIALVILIVLGIVFKNRLKEFWFRVKSNFRKSGPPKRRPSSGFPSVYSPVPRRRVMPRRVMPTEHRPVPRHIKRPTKTSSELDDVLKKLKEMGK